MASTVEAHGLNLTWILLLGPILYAFAWYYFLDPLRNIPGPFYTRISSLWLLLQSRLGRRSAKVDQLHQRYGNVVRIGVNHVSINIPSALQTIYGNGREFIKTNWYDPFKFNDHPPLIGIFDADEHSEQRKNMNPAFSAKSLREFEPRMTENYVRWRRQLLKLFNGNKSLELDLNVWVNLLAFDLISHFSFGKPFGFVDKGYDYLGLIDLIDKRVSTATATGVLPPHLRPYTEWIPFDDFWRASSSALFKIWGLAKQSYEARLADPDPDTGAGAGADADAAGPRRDVMSYLLSARSEGGASLHETRIISQAHALIIAGSDSTAASIVNFVDVVSRDPGLQSRIQREIDDAYPENESRDDDDDDDDDWVPIYADTVALLPFTRAALLESLRLRPTAALGLERSHPHRSVEFGGHVVPRGTTVSVPTYSLHRNAEVFEDPGEFRPERWLVGGDGDGDKHGDNRDTARLHEHFNIFSHGPRSCIGQNFAWMEMMKSVVLIFGLFRVERIARETRLREGFFIKSTECEVRLTLRKAPLG